MPSRLVGQGLGLWAIVYVLVVGYFMYMAGKISSSLAKIAVSLEQTRAERAVQQPEV